MCQAVDNKNLQFSSSEHCRTGKKDPRSKNSLAEAKKMQTSQIRPKLPGLTVVHALHDILGEVGDWVKKAQDGVGGMAGWAVLFSAGWRDLNCGRDAILAI